MVGELVDDPARTRVSDVELALHKRDRGRALGRHRARRTGEERVELALLPPLTLPLGARSFLEDLLHVARPALRLPEVDHAVNFLVADESTLDASRFPGVDRLVEHVAPTEQLFRTARIEDHPAVDLRADGEGDARRDVGLDEPGDDVCGRPLRGDDEVDADRPGKLRDPADELFDLAGRHHHQVGQLVDHDDDVRQPPGELLRRLVVVGGDVAYAFCREELVAAIHLRHGPA